MPGKCLLRRLHSPWLQKAVSDLGTGGFDWMPGIRRDLWLNPLCTADMWRAWEGNKLQKPLSKASLARSHVPLLALSWSCQTPCPRTQHLYDVPLEWKGSWLGESSCACICYRYKYIYAYRSAHTHKHTCSSGKGKRQNGLVIIYLPALQCSKGSIKFSCPMRELLALDLLVLPSQ